MPGWGGWPPERVPARRGVARWPPGWSWQALDVRQALPPMQWHWPRSLRACQAPAAGRLQPPFQPPDPHQGGTPAGTPRLARLASGLRWQARPLLQSHRWPAQAAPRQPTLAHLSRGQRRLRWLAPQHPARRPARKTIGTPERPRPMPQRRPNPAAACLIGPVRALSPWAWPARWHRRVARQRRARVRVSAALVAQFAAALALQGPPRAPQASCAGRGS